MNAKPRTRLSFGLLCAAIPALTFAHIAFWAWNGAGPRALQDWRWFAAGTVVFTALVVGAGFIVIGEESAVDSPSSRHRGSATPGQQRIAWMLLVAGLLAYFFYRSASRSWFYSLPFVARFHFLNFQAWYWWVGALLVSFALMTAAAVVAFRGERYPHERATTPIEDTTHRLLLDAHGNEIAEVPSPASELVARAPDTPVNATAERSKPNIHGRDVFASWLLCFAVTMAMVLVLMSLRLSREAAREAVAVLSMTASVAFAVWIFVRNR
jgi:hypothetical protein